MTSQALVLTVHITNIFRSFQTNDGCWEVVYIVYTNQDCIAWVSSSSLGFAASEGSASDVACAGASAGAGSAADTEAPGLVRMYL